MSSVNAITRSIDVASKEDGAIENVMKGMKAILHVFAAALENGDEQGWLTRLTDETGNSFFTEEEAADLEPKLQPLADGLRSMVKGPTSQTGGGPDEMYEGFLNAIDSVSQMVQGFARTSGTLQMELASDFKPDAHPFTPLGIPFGPTGIRIASEVPLPYRTFMFLTYLGLDVVRIFTSMPGFDMPFLRKTLSVIAAAADILRGDWLKALLSFAGFFQASYVYMGFLGKVAVSIFSMVSPDLQEDIGWGTFKVLKSATMGFMLTCFQTFAPYELRQQVYTTFGQILNKKICEAEAVKGAVTTATATATTTGQEGGSTTATTTNVPRAVDQRLPTDSTIQRIQTAMAQPSSVCSDEVQQIIGVAQQNVFLRIALQLANIPTTPYALQKSCKQLYDYVGEKGHHDWKTLLMAEGMLDYLVPNRDKSDDNISEQDKAKADLPHNKAVTLKKELQQLKDKQNALKPQIDAAEQALIDASNNPVTDSKPLETIVTELFPQDTITHTFKGFDYNTFLKVMNYVIKAEYSNKDLSEFASLKGDLTDAIILDYTQTLYEILDTPGYELIHEKVFAVNRIINAIKRREWGLIGPTLESIESKVKELYLAKAKEIAIKKAQDLLEDLKRQQTVNQALIESKTDELLAATGAMVNSIDEIAEQTEKTIAAAKGKELVEKSEAQQKESEAKKAAEETAKKAEEDKRIEEEVQKRVAALPPTQPPTVESIPATPINVAKAMSKAVSNVIGRIGEPSTPSKSVPIGRTTYDVSAGTITISGESIDVIAGQLTYGPPIAGSIGISGETISVSGETATIDGNKLTANPINYTRGTLSGVATIDLTIKPKQKGGSRKQLKKGRRLTKRAKHS